MRYRKVSKEEFLEWARQHPGEVGLYNGQEVKAPVQQAQDLGAIGNILRGVTKPLRAVASMPEYVVQAFKAAGEGQTGLEPGQFKSIFLTPEEELAWSNDPVKQGLKSTAALSSFLIPGGGGAAKSALGRIGTAAGRGMAAGTVGGLGYSEEGEELKGMGLGALTGLLTGGATQGIGEGIRGIRSARVKVPQESIDIYLDDITDVQKVAKLPDKARKGLEKLAKSAGYNDPGLSKSKNILNYINNRKLAGTTPGETLENMTQEFAKASKLKGEGLEEIGGLSRDYLNQAKNNFDEAIRFKGLSLDKEGTGVYNDIQKTFLSGPTDAKSLDNILMKWNEAGRNAKGAQKLGLSGLYADASKALRDVLRSTKVGGKYDSALKSLSQILGLDDEGVVSAAATQAEKTGINLPMFQNAGVYGTDIKAPAIANASSKIQAGIGQRQLQSGLSDVIPGVQQGSQELPKLLQMLIGGTQRGIPAMTYTGGQVQMPEEVQPQGLPEQDMGQTGPDMTGINMMLAQGILSGKISPSEAEAVLSLLGMSDNGSGGKMTEAQRDYQLAAEAIQDAYSVLEQSGGAGKLATIGGDIAGFFGSTTASSEYRAALDTATAFLRKALIGSGQSEAELKNLNLPKPTDEPEIAKQKIATLMPLLRARAGLQEY